MAQYEPKTRSKQRNIMGKYNLKDLWGLWRRGEITVEMATGQILQHLLEMGAAISPYKSNTTRSKQRNIVEKYDLKTLWELWKRGEIPVEETISQILQHLLEIKATIIELKQMIRQAGAGAPPAKKKPKKK